MAKVPRAKHRPDSKPTDKKVGYKKIDPAKRIQKGEVRNPKGVNMSLERWALRQFSKNDLSGIIQKVIQLKPDEIEKLLKSKEVNGAEMVIIGSMFDAIKNRNFPKLVELLEFVIGKVANKVDITTNGQSLNLTASDEAKLKEIIKKVEDEY